MGKQSYWLPIEPYVDNPREVARMVDEQMKRILKEIQRDVSRFVVPFRPVATFMNPSIEMGPNNMRQLMPALFPIEAEYLDGHWHQHILRGSVFMPRDVYVTGTIVTCGDTLTDGAMTVDVDLLETIIPVTVSAGDSQTIETYAVEDNYKLSAGQDPAVYAEADSNLAPDTYVFADVEFTMVD